MPRFENLRCKCGIDYVKYNARGPAPVRCDFCLQRIKSRQNAIRVARHYRKINMITNSQALILKLSKEMTEERLQKDLITCLTDLRFFGNNPEKSFKIWITVEEVKDAPTL